MSDLIDRQAAIESIQECADAAHSNHEWDMEQGYRNAIECIEEEPPAQPVPTYQTCSNALLKMWMDKVLTDGEYNRIMDKLNAWKGEQNE